jgi:hypothetical protein
MAQAGHHPRAGISARFVPPLTPPRESGNGFLYTAGVRTVNMPLSARQVLEDHLEQFVGPGNDASLFVGRTGQPLRPRSI